MLRLVEFLSRAGGNVVVEVVDGLSSSVPIGSQVTRSLRPSTLAAEASESFESSFGRIRPVATAIIDKLRQAADAPDEIEVEFGVRLSADVGAIIAKASGDANFKASLQWKGGSS